MLRLVLKQTWQGHPIGPEEQVSLELATAPGNQLRIRVRAPFHDDPPPPAPRGPTIGLWEHEVVELFVLGASPSPDAPPEYTEIELGPHGHHLVLQLRGVRQVTEKLLPLQYETHRDDSDSGAAWRGEALLDRALLPPPPHRFNAYAIHGQGQGDARRYLALHAVPGDGPDFHRLTYFKGVTLPGD